MLNTIIDLMLKRGARAASSPFRRDAESRSKPRLKRNTIAVAGIAQSKDKMQSFPKDD